MDSYQNNKDLHAGNGDSLTNKEQLGTGQFMSVLKIFDERVLKAEEKCLSTSKEMEEKMSQKFKRYDINIDNLTEKNKDLTNQVIILKEKLQSQQTIWEQAAVLVQTQFEVKSLEVKVLQNCFDQLQKHVDNLDDIQTKKIDKLIEHVEEINNKQEKMDEDLIEMKKINEDNVFNLQNLEEKMNNYEMKLNSLEEQILKGNQKNNLEIEKLLISIPNLQSDISLKNIELLKENCLTKSQKVDNLYEKVEMFELYIKNVQEELKDMKSQLSVTISKQDNFNKLYQEFQDIKSQFTIEEQNKLKKLPNKSANLEAKINKEGDTLFFVATRQPVWHDLVDLINQGANIECKNNDDLSPLHIAALNGQRSVVTELLNHGADIECKTKEGSTPLHLAAAKGHESVVIDLIKYGANVNHKDNDGNTAVHFASKGNKYKVLIELIKNKADINYRNNYGYMPIDYNNGGYTHQVLLSSTCGTL